MTGTTPPGWYDDGRTQGAWRWWDGTQWTDHLHRVAPAPEPTTTWVDVADGTGPDWGPTAAYDAAPATPAPWWKRRSTAVIGGGGLAAVLLVAAVTRPGVDSQVATGVTEETASTSMPEDAEEVEGLGLFDDADTTSASTTSTTATTTTTQAVQQSCDPNYSGACVPIASDVDCAGGSGNGPAYVQGPVTVIGSDIYNLDDDNNGIGCEQG